LAQSGIGKVNPTIYTQMMIVIYKPEKLVFSGVAGSFLPNMRARDIFVATHVV
jgi:adenosylhomocysteine nucleosidase